MDGSSRHVWHGIGEVSPLGRAYSRRDLSLPLSRMAAVPVCSERTASGASNVDSQSRSRIALVHRVYFHFSCLVTVNFGWWRWSPSSVSNSLSGGRVTLGLSICLQLVSVAAYWSGWWRASASAETWGLSEYLAVLYIVGSLPFCW